jgi:MFS family permease
MTGASDERPRSRLPFTVVALGVTSFFTDVGSEMIFPLLPAFLTSLGASPAFLGLVEGAADAVASIFKLGIGYASDRFARRKPLVLLGYGLATFARPLMGIAGAPWQVLAVRLTDRVGKGIRTAPRDALISGAVPREQAGRAFGLQRAMDHAGAAVGPLIATVLLGLGWAPRSVFLLAVVPGVLALGALLPVREDPHERAPASVREVAREPAPALSRSFYGYLTIVVLFALGNASDAFLLLRARDLGVPAALIPMLWAVLHVSKVLCSYIGGMLADRLPRTRLVAAGWGVFALVYLGFAAASAAWHVWALFVVYGVYYGLTEPTEKAMVKDLAPPAAQGRAFGWYNFAVGVSAVPAGLITGFVWQSVSPQAALQLGAVVAASASGALIAFAPRWQRPAS